MRWRWMGSVRGVWLVACLVACEKHPARQPPPDPAAAPAVVSDAEGQVASDAAVRAEGALLEVVHRYRDATDKMSDGALPRAGRTGFLDPPRESELAWMEDRGTPVATRLERALQLFNDSKAIMKRYGVRDMAAFAKDPAHAGDSVEVLRWSEAVVREFARIASLMTVEFVPTLSPTDPTYATRMDGLAKMRIGAAGMLQGTLIMLKARRAPVAERRRLAAVWRVHAAPFAALWQPAQCARLVQAIDVVLGGETDAGVAGHLKAIERQLATCRGGPEQR